jgi:hypothetical protein
MQFSPNVVIPSTNQNVEHQGPWNIANGFVWLWNVISYAEGREYITSNWTLDGWGKYYDLKGIKKVGRLDKVTQRIKWFLEIVVS